MKRHALRTVLCVLLAAVVLTAFAYLAGGGGSQGDPLVTLSYLTGAFTDQVLEKVDKALEERGSALRRELEQEIAQAERPGFTYMHFLGQMILFRFSIQWQKSLKWLHILATAYINRLEKAGGNITIDFFSFLFDIAI